MMDKVLNAVYLINEVALSRSGIRIDELFGIMVCVVIAAYILTSIVLFIIDGIKAKKEGRKRKAVFIVMLIVAIFILVAVAAVVLFVWWLGYMIMRSM